VRKNLRHPHPLSASLDHLVPLSAGGVHAPDNVALAHLRCNIMRSNVGAAQLILVG
jgi:5-methylcytosine-specific restriction endonuclease McrA